MGSLFGKPKPDDFASEVLKAAKAAGLQGTYDREKFMIRFEPGIETWLGNLYQQACVSKAERARVIRMVISMAQQAGVPLPSWDEARPRLLPRPVHRLNIEEARVRGASNPHSLFSERVAVSLVLDFPDRILHLTEASLADWGVTAEECLGPARDNLWRISNEPFELVAPGLWAAPWKDNYAAARVTLQSLLLKLEVDGDPVVWIPDRDTLWVTGSRNQKVLDRIYGSIAKNPAHNYAICLAPLRLAGETWELLAPPPLTRLVTAADYAEQAAFLNEHNERTGEDIYVANCGTVNEKKTGDIAFTWTPWCDGLPSLLPRTDRVFLGDQGNPMQQNLTWDELIDQYGSKMEPTDLWPPRWRVCNWS